MSASTTDHEIINRTDKLLTAIDQRDWDTYQSLCDPSITAFEPEAQGHLVSGMAFHAFYLEDQEPKTRQQRQSSISAPHVRIMGDVALICYVRLTQIRTADSDTIVRAEETRVWQRQGESWKHVHFHRSNPS